jgi:hypothetical protein
MVADFSGYVTKYGLKCTDGRTIMPDAFKEQDGLRVPLVWQHGHNDPANVLGHAVLEHRADGVYCYGYFNETEQGKSAKILVQHKDITNLSIYANKLVEKSKQVFHGAIREASLVLAGANPGAFIDNVTFQHSDGSVEDIEDEAIIYSGLVLEHEDLPDATPAVEEQDDSSENAPEGDTEVVTEEEVEHADAGPTVQDIYDSLSPEQKDVVHYMIGAALEQAAAQHSDTNSDEENLVHQEGTQTMNVFEQNGDSKKEEFSLSHSDIKEIVASASKMGSLKEAVEAYALQHGIENIDILFPDARSISNTPEFDKRRTEWVSGVINGTRHSPFSRIKTLSADLTFEDARAKGYIKGTMKKEEFFSVAKRITTPTTIYKKQKLDRDDIVDITDFDVVTWMKGEMRLMLDEEVARAVLIGDGRDVADEDKINESNIRPIAKEDELYAVTVNVNLGDASSSMNEVIEAIISARKYYKGTGTPTFYTTEDVLTKMLLLKDTLGRRLYRSVQELASDLRVDSIVTVEVMESESDLVGIVVNLQDYVLGADRGGEVNMFDDFDIDYNQYKYLIETRLSGALVKIKSALVVKNRAATDVLLANPTPPSFNSSTNVVTVPTITHVTFKNGEGATLDSGAQDALTAGQSLTVTAVADSGYYFAENANKSWTFHYEA